MKGLRRNALTWDGVVGVVVTVVVIVVRSSSSFVAVRRPLCVQICIYMRIIS